MKRIHTKPVPDASGVELYEVQPQRVDPDDLRDVIVYLNASTSTIHLSEECANSVHDTGPYWEIGGEGTQCKNCGMRQLVWATMTVEEKELYNSI